MALSPIKVLVVDDSAFMRQLVSDILGADPEITVIGRARDGLDALGKIARLRPDVVTLDVEMPRLDGLTTLAHIVKDYALPVVMLSALTVRGAETTLRALELGAVDFAAKPHTNDKEALDILTWELPLKVKAAARAKPNITPHPAPMKPVAPPIMPGTRRPNFTVLVIGTSTGGPSALNHFLSQLPADFPLGILVAQHMPPGFTAYLAERLNTVCPLQVREAAARDKVEAGLVLIAPAGSHLRFSGPGRVLVEPGGRELYRPSVDTLFQSAAEAYGRGVLALILTGMGDDGRRGLEVVKNRGGYVLAEAPETCVVYGMPRAAVEAEVVDEVVPLHRMAARVLHLVGDAGC